MSRKMKNRSIILILFVAISGIAQASFEKDEGSGFLTPSQKRYVQIISGPSKVNKEATIGIYLYNVENKKAYKKLDNFTVGY
jgi:hypothetical protein